MIYYDARSTPNQLAGLNELAKRRKVTKKMNVVCPVGHLAMRNVDGVPDEVFCPFCRETVKDSKTYVQFYGPGPRKLKRLMKGGK